MTIEETIGELCEKLLPIPEEVFFGNKNSSIVVCTLGSIELLKDIADSELMQNCFLVGRLFSENKGIDSLVRFVADNTKLRTIIICGKEVWGHKSGHSLIKLFENGIDESGRIIDSLSPKPFLTVSKPKIDHFRRNVKIINKIGETKISKIKKLINTNS